MQSVVHKMIPSAGIAVHHCWGLDLLLAILVTTFTLERVVRVARGRSVVLKQLPQTVQGEMPLDILSRIYNARRKRLLVRLPLENFLLYRACRDESIHKAVLFLPIAPDSCESLLICSRIPVGVEEYQSVGPNKVETTPSSFTTEKEYELISVGIVELIHKLLALRDIHRSIEAKGAIIPVAAELVEHVEGLSIIADKYDLIVCILPNSCKHSVEDLHLA